MTETTKTTTITHRIIRPSAGIVSRHRSLRAAQERLASERRGARRQGGYSRDFVEAIDADGEWRRVD